MSDRHTTHVDIESFSRVDLLSDGTHRYAEDASTEILLLCWATDNEQPQLWVPVWPSPKLESFFDEHYKFGAIHWGPVMPPELLVRVEDYGTILAAHNAEFERTMLNGHAGAQIGFPSTRIGKWKCTAAKAAAHGLPRSLDKVGSALNLSVQKDKVGGTVLRQLMRPRNPTKNDPRTRIQIEDNEDAYDKYCVVANYCADDVRTERALDHRVPDLPPLEARIWRLDQEINDRGVCVDIEVVNHIQWAVEEYKVRLVAQCVQICGFKPSQTEKITGWLRAHGLPDLVNLQKDTIDAILDDMPPSDTRTVLQARRSFQMKAVAKFEAIIRSVCEDGRVHGMFLYHGAGTGRWSSKIVQLQNLFRGDRQVDSNEAIERIKEAGLDALDAVIDRWPNVDPMTVFGCCVRGMLVPGDFFELACNDYSSIEARITAWLAGQEDILEVFREHGLIYEYTAAKMKGLNAMDVEGILRPMKKVNPDLRFSGKTCTLAFGFQGGHNAYIRGAKQAGVDVEEQVAINAKNEWRAANPKIVDFWYDMEEAAKNAVLWPGAVYANKGTKKIVFKRVGDFLYMKLPSGRKLAYYKPYVDDEGLTYMGIDTFTRRWMRVRTYGGRLTENAVQATAADILRRGMLNLEEAGYTIVGTVHDEAITENQLGFGSLEEMSELMCKMESWADGLPLDAAGFISQRYRKDG